MAELSGDYIPRVRDALLSLHGDLAAFNNDHGVEPASGSQAHVELARFPAPEHLPVGWAIANLLIESGGEHVTAFVKTITEPMEALACWTCVRSMLESCALAAWLFDPAIDDRTRLRRIFGLRYEGLTQQHKLSVLTSRGQGDLDKSTAFIDNVEKSALKLGIAPIVNDKEKRTGIGEKLPPATEMIKLMLNEEAVYRLLSAVAHGHSWALMQLGFRSIPEQPAGLPVRGLSVSNFEKTVFINYTGTLGLVAAQALARPHWNKTRYFGWDQERLKEVLKRNLDKLPVKPAAGWSPPWN